MNEERSVNTDEEEQRKREIEKEDRRRRREARRERRERRLSTIIVTSPTDEEDSARESESDNLSVSSDGYSRVSYSESPSYHSRGQSLDISPDEKSKSRPKEFAPPIERLHELVKEHVDSDPLSFYLFQKVLETDQGPSLRKGGSSHSLLQELNTKKGFYETLRSAIIRYEKWILLKHKYPSQYLFLPHDIRFVLMIHLQHPVQYSKTCKNFFGRVLDFLLQARKSSLEETKQLWKAEYSEDIRYCNGDYPVVNPPLASSLSNPSISPSSTPRNLTPSSSSESLGSMSSTNSINSAFLRRSESKLPENPNAPISLSSLFSFPRTMEEVRGGIWFEAIAKFDFHAETASELSLKKGSTIFVLDRSDDGWYGGELASGQRGYFPGTYCELIRRSEAPHLPD